MTGKVERGRLRLGEPVEVVGLGPTVASVAIGLETFGKSLATAQAGDNAAVLLRGVKREQVERGQVVAVPGSVTTPGLPGNALRTDQGRGRPARALPGELPAAVPLPDDGCGRRDRPGRRDLVMPGDPVPVTVQFGTGIAMETGLGFAVREGGRTVAAGTVTELLD